MATIAILDERIPVQLGTRPEAFDGLEVVWAGSNPETFVKEVPPLRPDIIVVSLDLLSDHPHLQIGTLLDLSKAQRAIALYSFARRDTIRSVMAEGARPLKSPVSLEALRAQMTSVIVRSVAESASEAIPVKPPQLSTTQLARLVEHDSAVQCECPNNLAQLLTDLLAFERYSSQCVNRNPKDAEVHRDLAESTGRARAVLEDAMMRLLAHENIDPGPA